MHLGSPIHYPIGGSPNRFVDSSSGSATLSQHLQRLQLHQPEFYPPSSTGVQGNYNYLFIIRFRL